MNAPQFMNKWTLKLATTNLIERYLLSNGLFESIESIPEHYIEKLSKSFTSPRILNTTVQLNSILSKNVQGDFNEVAKYNLHIIWGILTEAILLLRIWGRLTLFHMVIIFLLTIRGKRLIW